MSSAVFARGLRAAADSSGARRGQAFAATLLGEIELVTGRLQSAEAQLREAVALEPAGGFARRGVSSALLRLAETGIRGWRRRGRPRVAGAVAGARAFLTHRLPPAVSRLRGDGACRRRIGGGGGRGGGGRGIPRPRARLHLLRSRALHRGDDRVCQDRGPCSCSVLLGTGRRHRAPVGGRAEGGRAGGGAGGCPGRRGQP